MERNILYEVQSNFSWKVMFLRKRLRGQSKTIFEIIRPAGEISLEELKDSTEINYNTIRSAVIRMTDQGLIERVGRGKYQFKKE